MQGVRRDNSRQMAYLFHKNVRTQWDSHLAVILVTVQKRYQKYRIASNIEVYKYRIQKNSKSNEKFPPVENPLKSSKYKNITPRAKIPFLQAVSLKRVFCRTELSLDVPNLILFISIFLAAVWKSQSTGSGSAQHTQW